MRRRWLPRCLGGGSGRRGARGGAYATGHAYGGGGAADLAAQRPLRGGGPEAVAEALASSALFSELGGEALAALAARFRAVRPRARRGDYVIRQGAGLGSDDGAGEGFYVLAEGVCGVYLADVEGASAGVARYGGGEEDGKGEPQGGDGGHGSVIASEQQEQASEVVAGDECHDDEFHDDEFPDDACHDDEYHDEYHDDDEYHDEYHEGECDEAFVDADECVLSGVGGFEQWGEEGGEEIPSTAAHSAAAAEQKQSAPNLLGAPHRVLAEISAPGTFGELAALYGLPRRTSVVVHSPSAELYVLPSAEFRRMAEAAVLKRRRAFDDLLAQVPLFTPLEPHQRAFVADGMRVCEFTRGEAIIKQGLWKDDDLSFYVVMEGECEVFLSGNRRTDEGKRKNLRREIVASLHRGSHFGELSLLLGVARQATVRATTGVRCAVISKAVFDRTIANDEIREDMLEHARVAYANTFASWAKNEEKQAAQQRRNARLLEKAARRQNDDEGNGSDDESRDCLPEASGAMFVSQHALVSDADALDMRAEVAAGRKWGGPPGRGEPRRRLLVALKTMAALGRHIEWCGWAAAGTSGSGSRAALSVPSAPAALLAVPTLRWLQRRLCDMPAAEESSARPLQLLHHTPQQAPVRPPARPGAAWCEAGDDASGTATSATLIGARGVRPRGFLDNCENAAPFGYVMGAAPRRARPAGADLSAARAEQRTAQAGEFMEAVRGCRRLEVGAGCLLYDRGDAPRFVFLLERGQVKHDVKLQNAFDHVGVGQLRMMADTLLDTMSYLQVLLRRVAGVEAQTEGNDARGVGGAVPIPTTRASREADRRVCAGGMVGLSSLLARDERYDERCTVVQNVVAWCLPRDVLLGAPPLGRYLTVRREEVLGFLR